MREEFPTLSNMMLSRYSHFEDAPNVRGYVVNAFDALNFDIDLDLPEELRKRYRNVIQNRYSYKDEGTNSVKTGITYRCRLRGISVVSKLKGKSNYKGVPRSIVVAQRKAHIDIIRQFDRQNGWVQAVVSDVDVYRRILVDIIDPVSSHDFRNKLLSEEYSYVYEMYRGGSYSDGSESQSPPDLENYSEYDDHEEDSPIDSNIWNIIEQYDRQLLVSV